MTIEALPQDSLKNKLDAHTTQLTAYQDLNTALKGVRTGSQDLALGYNWKAKTAASSSTGVTATASPSAQAGTISFKVNSLATAQSMASFGTVSSTSTVIGSGNLTIGQTGSIGLSNLKGTGVATGAHTFAVTQASAGASASGSALPASITLSGSETLSVNIDGVAKTFTLTAGTYTQKSLAAMVTDVSAGELSVSTNANTSLKLSTTHEGSAASLQITGGTGLAKLGLAAGAATNGVDGVVTVDGVSNTVSDIRPDGSNSVTLNASAGTFSTGFSGGLRVGTANTNTVSLGSGTLASVVDAINSSGQNVTAAAVQVSEGNFKLQVQSSTTGKAGAIGMDLSAFSGVLGNMETVSAASNAVLQVGSGASGYTIESSSNTMANVLDGVTLNLTEADPTKTVNITIAGDGAGLADKVSAMITSVNDALAFIKNNSKYDQASKTGGAFLGNSTARNLEQGLMQAIGFGVGGSSLGAASAVGIKLNANGTYDFDKSAFITAYQAKPEEVAKLFTEGGSSSASTTTVPGIAERLNNLAKSATDLVSGKITTVIQGENSLITSLNEQISSWDDRLAKRRTTLERMYTALNTAMAQSKSTGDWLTGQIDSMSNNR